MIKFLLTHGIGFTPESIKYIPTLGLSTPIVTTAYQSFIAVFRQAAFVPPTRMFSFAVPLRPFSFSVRKGQVMTEELLVFSKQPVESYDIDLNYTSRLPLGASALASGTVSALNMSANRGESSLVLASTAITVVSAVKAQVGVRAGADGVDYKLTFEVTFDTGAVLSDEVTMQVREK